MSVKSPIKWHGGKFYMLPTLRRIESRLKDKPLTRAEHFAGSLAWTLDHEPEGVSEVVNDLNGDLSNFWRVLAGGVTFNSFCRLAQATPFSESDWGESFSTTECGEVVDAMRFFVRCRQSLAGRMKSFAPVSVNRTRRGMNEQVSAWLTAIDGLPEVHQRLRPVLVLNRDFEKSIEATDSPKTLHYLDPPYMPDTRAAKAVYEHEMTVADHLRLLDAVKQCKGRVMISGYANETYDTALKEWKRDAVELPNNAAGGSTKRRMTEVVWSNF